MTEKEREQEITSVIHIITMLLRASELSLETIRKYDTNIIVLKDLKTELGKKYPIEEKWQGKKL